MNTDDFDVNRLMDDINNNHHDTKFRTYLPKEISIQTIALRVQELNQQVLKENPKKFKQIDPNNAKIMKLENSLKKPLHLIFYGNCVHLESFPPFTYGSKDAIGLLTDLMDGFFPRQLEKSHPDGILLELIDRLDEMKAGAGEDKIKRGGVKVGGASTPTQHIIAKQGLNQLINGYETLEDQRGRELTKDQFLDKLPNKVIKNGMIVEIKSEISKKLGMDSKGSSISYYDKFVLNQYSENTTTSTDGKIINLVHLYQKNRQEFELQIKSNRRLHMLSSNNYLIKNGLSLSYGYDKVEETDVIANGLCVVKLRIEGLETTLVYYEKKAEKMLSLVECIRNLLGVDDDSVFKFVQHFPRKELQFVKDQDSFDSLGLSPRAALHLCFD